MNFRWMGLVLLFPLCLIAENEGSVVRLKNEYGIHGTGVIIGPGAVLTAGHVLSNIDDGGIAIAEGDGKGALSNYVAAYKIALGKRPTDDRWEIMKFATHDVAVLVFPGNPFRNKANLVQPSGDNQIYIGVDPLPLAIGFGSKVQRTLKIRPNGFWPNQWKQIEEKDKFEKEFGKDAILHFVNPIGQNQRSGLKMPGPGYSGGPVFNSKDEVAGVCVLYQRAGGSNGHYWVGYLNVKHENVQLAIETAKKRHPRAFR